MMNPCRSGHTDSLLNNIDERSNIVISNTLTLAHFGNKIGVHNWCTVTTSLSVVARHYAQSTMSRGCQQFDF